MHRHVDARHNRHDRPECRAEAHQGSQGSGCLCIAPIPDCMTYHSPFDGLETNYNQGAPSTHLCREEYLEACGDNEIEAQRWFACGIAPTDVQHFLAMGLNPEEAISWGLKASLIQRFRALGFTKSQAREWALAGIWPDHAVHWRRADFSPENARLFVEKSASPSAALAWTLLAAEDSQLFLWAEQGRHPGELLAEQQSNRAKAN